MTRPTVYVNCANLCRYNNNRMLKQQQTITSVHAQETKTTVSSVLALLVLPLHQRYLQQNYYKYRYIRYQSSYSRMLDLGGQSNSLVDDNNNKTRNRVDVSRNCQIQAVCFDFTVLTRSIQETDKECTIVPIKNHSLVNQNGREESQYPSSSSSSSNRTTTTKNVDDDDDDDSIMLIKMPQPDSGIVQSIADLLKIDLVNGKRFSKNDPTEDELALQRLIGSRTDESVKKGGVDNNNSNNPANTTTTTTTKDESSSTVLSNNNNNENDIRIKYTEKLHKKGITGGIQEIQKYKQQQIDEGKLNNKGGGGGGGDAAIYKAGRTMVAKLESFDSTESNSSTSHHRNYYVGGQHWIALTGTGSLLRFLSYRSIKIAVVPTTGVLSTNNNDNNNKEKNDNEEGVRMEDLKKQLYDVTFNILYKDGTNKTVPTILQDCIEQLQLHPSNILFVSDKDYYIRSAKDAGMITVRILPENARRGNVSAQYTVRTILDTQEIINQMNGISFNTVLQ